MTGLSIPSAVRSRALSQGRQDWLEELDDLLDRLCHRWRVERERIIDGGTTSLVAEVRGIDRPAQTAVLKVALPGLGFDDQLRLLHLADGRGYVRVLEADPDSEAALLERLGSRLGRSTGGAADPEQQLRISCDLLRRAWQLPADGYRDQTWDKAEQLAELIEQLWSKHRPPIPERVIDVALECAARRAAAPRDSWVVVHGDPHPENTLRVIEDRPGAVHGFVFVDPDGFWADPGYDVGVVLRDWSQDLLAGDARELMDRYCRFAAARTGLDRQPIWEWAYLERVSSGLFVTEVVGAEAGRPFLDAATRLLS